MSEMTYEQFIGSSDDAGASVTELMTEQTDAAVLAELVIKVDELQKTHNEILTLVSEIKDKVQPMMDSLSKSPIMKMLGV